MNHLVGKRACLFARVSSFKQSAQRQELELTKFCAEKKISITKKILTTVSGRTKGKRLDVLELISSAKKKEFDLVVVSEISRLGRTPRDLRKTIDTLHDLRILIYFKNLNVLSLDEYGNESLVTNLIIAIYSEFAGEEVRLLSERVKSGLEKTKAQGKQLGRPTNSQESDEKQMKKYSKLIQDLKNGLSLNKCMKIHGVSKNTVIKVKRLIV